MRISEYNKRLSEYRENIAKKEMVKLSRKRKR